MIPLFSTDKPCLIYRKSHVSTSGLILSCEITWVMMMITINHTNRIAALGIMAMRRHRSSISSFVNLQRHPSVIDVMVILSSYSMVMS
ncbi:hypothetical protein L1987_02592 [Smallanthus sonchifolius]|uniref:Uncharacterized protein n=1 Tax=Smallanthus sonchifolius TaxID=185202 RepID=A0ACB9K8F1_9ASTR|nr:hypothetical protein L1987_02592 [Smallanthus sonchifolius]